MKVKVLAALLALSFLSAFILPVPAHAESLTLDPVQGTVGSSIKIPAFCSYGTGDYFLYWGANNELITQGTIKTGSCAPIYFKVPQSPQGKHTVSLKVGSKTFQKEFTVLPGISLGSKTGMVDASVSIEGAGFVQDEKDIKILFDGVSAVTGIQANNNGSWMYTLKIPVGAQGDHAISASGATTTATTVGSSSFKITPSISSNPKSGWVGRVISVSGTGFVNAEKDISVIYDAMVVKSGITADLTGSWQTNFSIPASSKGAHVIDAHGEYTKIGDITDLSFSVSPGIKVEQEANRLGEVINTGDTLYVGGFGFQENETSIQVTMDSMQVVSGITADAHGSWSSQFTVPSSAQGDHVIKAFGNATNAGDVTDFIVVITPQVSINPNSGSINESALLTGTGFGASKNLSITYDSQKMDTGAVTDAKGSFSTTLKTPVSGAGTHLIMITDGAQATGTAAFTIESTAPEIPSLISPEAGTKFSLLDNVPIEFRWSVVEDASGVIYSIEMSNKADFSGSATRKEKLEQPIYTLAALERPQAGELYWRVKAADLAGNTKGWSQSQLVLITGFDFLIWIIIGAVVVLAIIGIVIWRVRAISKKGGWSSSES